MTKEILSTNEVVTVDNYPYGRLQCEMTFSLEFTKRGFRSVRQSVNPKTGRINKPKKSTYSDIMVMYKDSDTGHVKYMSISLNGDDAINTAMPFLNKYFDKFTEDQVKHICSCLASFLVASMKASVIYCGAELEHIKPLYDTHIKTAIKGLKTGENVFNDIKLDIGAIKAVEVPDYQPFKVVQYG